MNILYLTVALCIGWIGGLMTSLLIQLYKKNKIISNIKSNFIELLINIKIGKSKFKTRIKNTVLIDSYLSQHGNVSVVFILDKNEISICKEDVCISTSTQISKDNLINDLIQTINDKYEQDINDVVEVMGIKISRSDFEKNINIQLSQLKKIKEINNPELNSIIKNNDSKFDVDEILDKINKSGLDSLTEPEKDFLKKFK